MDPQSLPRKKNRKIHKSTNYILIDLRDLLLGNHDFFKNNLYHYN